TTAASHIATIETRDSTIPQWLPTCGAHTAPGDECHWPIDPIAIRYRAQSKIGHPPTSPYPRGGQPAERRGPCRGPDDCSGQQERNAGEAWRKAPHVPPEPNSERRSKICVW